jgi:hypothetical protein
MTLPTMWVGCLFAVRPPADLATGLAPVPTQGPGPVPFGLGVWVAIGPSPLPAGVRPRDVKSGGRG